jgi:hypothetical protein
MHTLPANAYWKALNSMQPHIGSQFLHILVDSDELPPLKICGDLKTVLDQLLMLPYGEDNKNVANALNLHSFSMKVLLLLWDGLQTMDGTSTQELPLIRNLHAYGSKGASTE